jgi:hypothetical protein
MKILVKLPKRPFLTFCLKILTLSAHNSFNLKSLYSREFCISRQYARISSELEISVSLVEDVLTFPSFEDVTMPMIVSIRAVVANVIDMMLETNCHFVTNGKLVVILKYKV